MSAILPCMELIRQVSAIVAVLLLFSALATAASAEMQGYSASYDILDGKAYTDLAFSFGGNVSYFEWLLPKDAVLVETSPSYFEIAELKDSRKLVFRNGGFGSIRISYATDSLLQQSGNTVFFVSDVAQVDAPKKSVSVTLPERATLKYELEAGRSIVPLTGEVSTDGKRIKVWWTEEDFQNGNSILVIYSPANKSSSLPVVLVVLVLAGLAGFYIYRRKQLASPKVSTLQAQDSALTRNLFDDEKKIVELLSSSGEEGLWQKQLEIKASISKVKLSRKLRSLEQKGLIEKIPFGNANKIRLKRP